MQTGYVDFLDVTMYLLIDWLAPARDEDDSSEIERHTLVSEIDIDFGHRL